MANVFEYLRWRGDLPFSRDPVNEVDALIFCGLTYVRYGGRAELYPQVPVTLRQIAEEFFSMENCADRVRVKGDLELLRIAAETERFGSARLVLYRDTYIPEQETQFAAMTFLLEDGSVFLAYRGTDHTLVGWKEDFNMTFQQTVPAQRLAAQYAREAAMAFDGPLYLGGHSKGGNLAVFAGARSSPMVQSRIARVYNNDGPGFTQYMMGDPGYLAIVPQIRTYVPQSSVIGMLLEHEEPYTVIRSKSVGLLQHDLYSWEVEGKSFQPVREITDSSQFIDATMKDWFAGMTNQERNRLVDVLFGLLGTGEVENALDIFHPRNIRTYIRVLSTDADTRRVLSTEFLGLIESARRTREKLEAQRLLLEGSTQE